MWYLKQATKNIWDLSKNAILDNRSQVHKLLDEISDSQQEIIATKNLKQLSALTYDMDKFQQTLELVLKRIKTFQYDIDQAKKNLNILIATNYLIKHGASGFVDELRSYINVFKKYQTLKDIKTYQDQGLQKQLSYELEKIKSRAKHIQVLLEDKQKLLKEKQLAMLIKQKMILYEKNKISDTSNNISNDNRGQKLKLQKERINSQNKQTGKKTSNSSTAYGAGYAQKLQKLDGYLEKYLWKYVDKLDGKVQLVSDKIMKNFDKFVLGQMPPQFQPDSIQDEDFSTSPKKMSQQNTNQSNYKCLVDDDENDLMKKLEMQGDLDGGNLIDFEQVPDQQEENQEKKEKQSAKEESLI